MNKVTERQRKKASEEIAARLQQVKIILADCTKLANENNINLSWDEKLLTLAIVPDANSVSIIPASTITIMNTTTQAPSPRWNDSGCYEEDDNWNDSGCSTDY